MSTQQAKAASGYHLEEIGAKGSRDGIGQVLIGQLGADIVNLDCHNAKD